MIVKYPSEIVNKNPIKCFFFTRVVLGMVFTHSNTTVTREGHVYPFMFAPIVWILLILLVVLPFSIALSCTSNKGHKLSLPRWSHSSSWQENINYHLTLRPPLWITSAPSPSKRDFYPDTARNSSPRKNNPIPNFYEGSPIKFLPWSSSGPISYPFTVGICCASLSETWSWTFSLLEAYMNTPLLCSIGKTI